MLTTEDYSKNTTETLNKVSHLLDLEQLPENRLRPASWRSNVKPFTVVGDEELKGMLPKTRRLLDEFYEPFNQMLAMFLEDSKFSWGL